MAGRVDDVKPLHPVERLVPLLRHRWRGRFAVRALRLLGVEFPRTVKVGERLRLPHGAMGVVLDGNTVIGDDVTILHGVTIGISDLYRPESERRPGRVVIGDRVTISVGAVILYDDGMTLTVGDDAMIAANAVVRSDVPAGEVWGGIPARRLSANPNA